MLSHSFTSELPELDFVRIVGEGGEPVLPGVEGVDIAKADLHKFTNSAGACLSCFHDLSVHQPRASLCVFI